MDTVQEKTKEKEGESPAISKSEADKTTTASATPNGTASPRQSAPRSRQPGGRKRFAGSGRKKRPGGPRRGGRARSEYDQRVVDVRRVTRVVAGGRRFSFSVVVIIGDRKGSVGVGVGKASDTSLAVEKATKSAKKNMIKLKLDKNMSIPHDVDAKFSSARIMIMPAPAKGLVAGSSVRVVLELAGIHDVTAKILSRSKNKLNNARAAVKALEIFKVKKQAQ